MENEVVGKSFSPHFCGWLRRNGVMWHRWNEGTETQEYVGHAFNEN